MKKSRSPTNQFIKLHTSTNPWKPHFLDARTDENAETEEVYRKVRSILNKLTPQKFDTLVQQLKLIEIDTIEKLRGIVDLLFEKAITEPKYSCVYANTCKQLALIKVPVSSDYRNYINFKKYLLEKCQVKFEQDKSVEKLKQIENITDTMQMRERLEEKEWKKKQKQLGNVRFIGELYNSGILSEVIMRDYIIKLFQRNDENSLEYLCQLIKTIGKKLETKKENMSEEEFSARKTVMDEYIDHMQNIADSYRISSRIRFMLLDVIELRQNAWKPRRKEECPRKIDEIHEEVLKEEEEVMLQNLSKSSKHNQKKKHKGACPKKSTVLMDAKLDEILKSSTDESNVHTETNDDDKTTLLIKKDSDDVELQVAVQRESPDMKNVNFTREQSLELSDAIGDATFNIPDGEQVPCFKGTRCRGPYIIITAANEFSKMWLMEIVPQIHIWDTTLRAILADKILKLHRAIVWLPGKKKLDTEMALLCLQKQNQGLYATKWEVIRTTRKRFGLRLVVGMDEASVRYLEGCNFQPFYITEQAVVTLNDNARKPVPEALIKEVEPLSATEETMAASTSTSHGILSYL